MNRIGFVVIEVAEMLYGLTPDGRVDPRHVKRVRDAVNKGRIPCVRKPDGTRLVPYVIPAEWVEQARRAPTGPTAA